MNFKQQVITFKDIKTPPTQDGEYIISGLWLDGPIKGKKTVIAATYDADYDTWDIGFITRPEIDITAWAEMPEYPDEELTGEQ